jgi:hypothetical protein
MELPSDIPADQRPRYLILLSEEDWNSISHEQLETFLSPLFPATRPSNDKKIERLAPPPKKVIAPQFNMGALLQQALAQNAKLKK